MSKLNLENDRDPFGKFAQWFVTYLKASKLNYPAACTLSTIGINGTPNARTISLKEVRDPYVIFTTSLASQKAIEIKNNPNVSLTFWWEESERQVRIKGVASTLEETEAGFYFSERPKTAQVISTLSKQSAILESREDLEDDYQNALKKYSETKIMRPKDWGGFKVLPTVFEFMEFKNSRLHERIQYTKQKKTWLAVLLQP